MLKKERNSYAKKQNHLTLIFMHQLLDNIYDTVGVEWSFFLTGQLKPIWYDYEKFLPSKFLFFLVLYKYVVKNVRLQREP